MKRIIITTILIFLFLILLIFLWRYSMMGMNPFLSMILSGIAIILFFIIAYQIYKVPTTKQRWLIIGIFVVGGAIATINNYFWLKDGIGNDIPRRYIK